MPFPFEKQPRESAKAFAAFSLYLSLGAERSTREVGKQLGKSEGLIERWAAKFGWTDRVAAHGAHLAVVERVAIEAAARGKAAEWASREQKLRETEWTLRGELVEAGLKVLGKFKDGSRGATLGDVARAFEVASKLGRLATGLNTDGENTSGDKLPALHVEVSVALDKIYGEAEPAPAGENIVDVEEVQSPKPKVQSGSQSLLTSASTGATP
ncbi:MAG: hypothetical protein PHY43_09780 [Verrucomicrobiales bacterium]|nr:hypothetical protein [Verrucomicrobiales bacterium]